MKLSKLNCQYGAPMGRTEKHLTGNVGPIKLHLQAVPLDNGGYDAGGAYWGLRPWVNYTRPDGLTVKAKQQLYWFWWNGNKPSSVKPILIQGFIDAVSRDDAKTQILTQYPEAKFHR